jgi:hypothetical protein
VPYIILFAFSLFAFSAKKMIARITKGMCTEMLSHTLKYKQLSARNNAHGT